MFTTNNNFWTKVNSVVDSDLRLKHIQSLGQTTLSSPNEQKPYTWDALLDAYRPVHEPSRQKL